MLKVTSKRRRTLKQIKAEKEAKEQEGTKEAARRARCGLGVGDGIRRHDLVLAD